MHETPSRRVTAIALTATLAAGAAAASDDRLAREISGEEPDARSGARLERTFVIEGAVDLLLVPDSTSDAVMAFDPMTGDLVDAAFIPADPDNLSTPIQAILSAGGDSILVSDQIDDVVQEYDLAGNYMGIFAPAGGVDLTILNNIRGISLRENGNLLVAVSSGDNADSIAEFDPAGIYLGNFVANGDGGLDGPWAVHLDGALYSTGDGSDALHEFDLAGAYVGDLDAINNFPEQVSTGHNGNLFVADFLGTDEDVVEVTKGGTRVGVYDIAEIDGARGVYPLDNGNYLVTDGSGVYEVELPSATLVATEIADVSGRFVSRVTIGGGGGLALDITGVCPGEIQVAITGGTPNGLAALLRGSGPGSDVLAGGPCAGTETGLTSPAFLTTAPLDANGDFMLTRSVGPAQCGRILQAIDSADCSTSNTDTLP